MRSELGSELGLKISFATFFQA